MAGNKRVLVIPDMHMPYCHPDTWKFLAAVKAKYKPDRVVCLGDEIDGHALSYHESDPDLDSAGPELEKAIGFLKPIYKLFPRVDVLESNHGSLAYRRAKTAGIPRRLLKSYRDALDAPATWHWHHELSLTLPNGQQCYFTHGKTNNHLALAKSVACNAVSGHHHEKYGINYWNAAGGLFWQMQAGCLVDDPGLAFAYNKVNLHKPIIGCGVILNSQPMLIAMQLDKRCRWTGAIL